MAMIKTLISCAHCGGMFQVEYSNNATGSKLARHNSPCNKDTRLKYTSTGKISTEKG